jgi:hypothetical protein
VKVTTLARPPSHTLMVHAPGVYGLTEVTVKVVVP